MSSPKTRLPLFMLASIISLSLFFTANPARAQGKEEQIRIGMVQTLFTDVPAPLAKAILLPFAGVMQEFTGVKGRMVMGGDYYSLGKDLHDGKVEVAVFHGIEFGWAQQKFPDLKPLIVCCTKYKHAQAVMVVRKDSTINAVPDLKGKAVSLPLKSREHCRLFMARSCSVCGMNNPTDFFGQVAASSNVETALDDVCLDTVQAAIVDRVALEDYKEIKPGCFARLRILKDSELFPTGVIAYRDGSLTPENMTKFREGLAKACSTPRGREMMSMFKISSFDPVPDDYAQCLAEIMKVYPAPRPESGSPVSSPR